MIVYMRCMQRAGSDIGACRLEAKDYLACRMDKYASETLYFQDFTLFLPSRQMGTLSGQAMLTFKF